MEDTYRWRYGGFYSETFAQRGKKKSWLFSPVQKQDEKSHVEQALKYPFIDFLGAPMSTFFLAEARRLGKDEKTTKRKVVRTQEPSLAGRLVPRRGGQCKKGRLAVDLGT